MASQKNNMVISMPPIVAFALSRSQYFNFASESLDRYVLLKQDGMVKPVEMVCHHTLIPPPLPAFYFYPLLLLLLSAQLSTLFLSFSSPLSPLCALSQTSPVLPPFILLPPYFQFLPSASSFSSPSFFPIRL